MNSFRTWGLAQRYGLSAASVALITLQLIQLPSLHEANIALLYLLMVLISATTIGLGPALLANLIENTIKYTPADTPIMIEAGEERDTMRIEVRDHGPGIPAGLSTRIFDKFVRVAGPERHADGMGLGLAIGKGIIELHQGRIWVENLSDGGACFIFTLPLHAPAHGAVTRTTMRQMQAGSL
jgi:K+-sensing histidine kinase KdpD